MIEEELGSGSFGSVFKVKDNKTGEFRAIKISNTGINIIDKKRFIDENLILYKLSPHPRILTPHTKVIEIEKPFQITYYVMELGDCDLAVFINTNQLTDTEKLEIFSSICEGMQHAHNNSVVHRDLHYKNILIIKKNGQLEFKINDFGRAKDFDIDSLSEIPCWGFYVSPPEFRFKIWETPQLQNYIPGDIYALGIILFTLFSTFPSLPITSLFSNINEFFNQQGVKDIGNITYKKREYLYQEWLKTKAPDKLFALALKDYALQTSLNGVIEKLCNMDFNKRYKDINSILKDISKI
ncbi:MAG: protein kinase [Candidatus Pacebacteria bacterium]|nr:protein kinase [Candidatus Paceibacterota bacterium]